MLSLCRVTGSTALGTTSRLISRLLSHTASCTAAAAAMYSASIVDNAIISCFLLLQEIAPPFSEKQKLMSACAHQGLQPNQHLCILEAADQNHRSTMCNWWSPLGIVGLS